MDGGDYNAATGTALQLLNSFKQVLLHILYTLSLLFHSSLINRI